ncbi:MAG TPA: hypothetical protein VHC94_11495 [Nitrobacter sp.]|jgi:hypothetical protein|nr:hypothetical protein [Nitrobacter sp.]
MAINGISFGSGVLGGSIQSLKNQLADLQNQLTSGKASTTYSGMGANEGFAIAARSQLSNIAGFTDTMAKVNTTIGVENTALQALVDIGTQLQTAATSGTQALNSVGQTAGQQTAVAELGSMLDILNTQSGDRYIFSGSALNTPAVVSQDTLLNGNPSQGIAGLKQVISERNQADLGSDGLGRIAITQPSSTSVSVAEDASPSVFGMKLQSVSSSLTGASLTTTPATINLPANATNGQTFDVTFQQSDGTSKTVTLTATTTVPPPAGSFAIGTTAADTAANLNAALASAEGATGQFGAQLTGVSSSMSGVTVTPAQTSIDLGTTNPQDGDTVSFSFSMPDGTTEAIQLTASSATPTPAGSFAIGATPAATAANLQTALSSSIGTLANTSLVAASAVQATNDFFGSPPLRVNVTPPATLATATSQTDGTANTVAWYTGNTSTTSARASSTARVDQSITVQYGMQANEQAIVTQLKAVAVMAAFSAPATGTNSAGQISALNDRVAQNLTAQPGQQTIQDIQTDLANAQTVMKDATSRQTLTQATLQDVVDQAENVSTDQVASQLLALQTNLQASYQTTSMLSQLSLVKFLPVG